MEPKALIVSLVLCGLGGVPVGSNAQEAKPAAPEKSKPKQNPKKKANPPGNKKPPAARKADQAPRKSSSATSAVEQAVNKVGTAIRESLEVGNTLVVWLFDRTPSAQALVEEVKPAAKYLYESLELERESVRNAPPLATAIAGFDESLEFVLEQPTTDLAQAKAGLNDVRGTAAHREMTFGALKLVLEKFAAQRTKERQEVLLVVVSDEAGDDPAVGDELAPLLRQAVIPLYVIGFPAPWGEVNPFAPNPKQRSATATDDLLPAVGPESLFSERVDIQLWSADSGSARDFDLVDSGFGPFALEKLCRASHGKFLAIRPEGGFFAAAARSWPPGRELKFDEGVARKYTPDYVSEADYQKLISENKARGVLHEAAKLQKIKLDGSPVTRFPKDSDAKMAKNSSKAQQFAASNSPAVDELYNALQRGEADRDKLAGPRWQAQFDLALGRVMATKVRLDGYNSMIAALKRGKSFSKPESTTWLLEPADSFETESTLRRLGERAKMYLERVMKEHSGTPWARIAEEELRTPLGWTWKES